MVMPDMLRKFFDHGGASDGIVSSQCFDAATKEKADNVCGDAEFAAIIARLEQFEADLKDIINKLSRHCQAICEMVASSRDLMSCVHTLSTSQDEALQTGAAASEAHMVLADISTFRTSSIAPLQTILASIPQLKLKCDHRNRARSVMIRYETKVEELQSTTRYESSRLRRNRAKHQVALARFKEVDSEVLKNVAALLANDLSDIAVKSVETLLIQHQAVTAKWMQGEVTGLQKVLEGYQTERKTQHQAAAGEEKFWDKLAAGNSSDNDSNNNADDDCMENPIVSCKVSSPRCSTPTASVKKPLIDDSARILPNCVLNQDQSVCPRKKHVHGTRTWNLHRHIKDSMACGLDLVDCIQLPEGCQLDEWIAVHVIDFFNEISLLFGTISEFCTPSSCPQMSAGPCYTYLWADGVHQVTPISLPAFEYVTRLLEWVERQFEDPQLFPEVYAASGSGEGNLRFMQATRNIFKRLFRVYAHMYHNHLQHYASLQAETHLNFCFKRFVLFVQRFDLIDQKELNALRKLIQTLLVGLASTPPHF